jgi:hypothetical protein
MTKEKKLITSVIGVLFITTTVHANMMPISMRDVGCDQSLYVLCGQTNLQYIDFYNPLNCSSLADLDLWSVEFLPKTAVGAGQTSVVQNLQSLTEGPNSIKFCLSALISLGLCCSA